MSVNWESLGHLRVSFSPEFRFFGETPPSSKKGIPWIVDLKKVSHSCGVV